MAGFRRDVLWTLFTQGILVGLGLGISVLTARALGVEHRGIYSLVLSIVSTTVLFAGAEFGQSLVYHAGRLRTAPGALVGASLSLPPLLGLAAAALLFAAWPLFDRAFEALPRESFLLALLLIPLTLLGSALSQFFRAVNRFDLFNLFRGLVSFARLAALGIAFALGAQVEGALLAFVAAEAVMALVTLVAVLRIATPQFGEGLRQIPSLLRFGFRIEAASALGYASMRISLFVVAYYMGPKEVAFYAIADALAQQIFAIPQVIGTVLLPKLSAETDETAAEMASTSHRGTLFLTLAVVVVIAIASKPLIVGLYGSAFAAATPLLAILMGGTLFRGGVRVLAPFLIATNHVREMVLMFGASLVVQTLLLALWTPRFGTQGAALATAVAFFLQWALFVLCFLRISGIGLRTVLLISRSDIEGMLEAVRGARDAARS